MGKTSQASVPCVKSLAICLASRRHPSSSAYHVGPQRSRLPPRLSTAGFAYCSRLIARDTRANNLRIGTRVSRPESPDLFARPDSTRLRSRHSTRIHALRDSSSPDEGRPARDVGEYRTGHRAVKRACASVGISANPQGCARRGLLAARRQTCYTGSTSRGQGSDRLKVQERMWLGWPWVGLWTNSFPSLFPPITWRPICRTALAVS